MNQKQQNLRLTEKQAKYLFDRMVMFEIDGDEIATQLKNKLGELLSRQE